MIADDDDQHILFPFRFYGNEPLFLGKFFAGLNGVVMTENGADVQRVQNAPSSK